MQNGAAGRDPALRGVWACSPIGLKRNSMELKPEDLEVQRLGACRIQSPISGAHFVEDGDQVVLHSNPLKLKHMLEKDGKLLALEKAGPREKIYFDPSKLKCGIVTCGGLCPGLNDVIRAVVLSLYHNYKVKTVFGFPYGYEGLTYRFGHTPVESGPGRREPHPRIRRDDPGLLARKPGYLRNGRHDGPHEPGHAVCGGRGRHAARGSGHLRGDPAPGAEDQRDRHPQDHRQRHLLRGAVLWLRDGRLRGGRVHRRGPHRGQGRPQRDRAGEAHGPGVRLHRRVRRARPQRRQHLPDPGGAVYHGEIARERACAPAEPGARGHRGGRGRRPGVCWEPPTSGTPRGT